MKKLFLLLIITAGLTTIYDRTHALGLGVIIGEPTGVSIKINRFPIIGVSWSVFNNRMSFTLDGWMINRDIKGDLDWYLGLGGSMYFKSTGIGENEIGVGVRVPVGLQFWVQQEWEIFMEVAPRLLVIPEPTFDPQGGIGVRYHF